MMSGPAKLIKLFSYFWPVVVHRTGSRLNPVLTITAHKGRYILDAANVNYSFGSLHQVMEGALLHALLVYDINPGSALILGYGGGSAALLLRQMFDDVAVTGIEHDDEVIKLASGYFEDSHSTIIKSDALIWLQGNHEKFDLILCDLFTEEVVPDFVVTTGFFELVKEHLNVDGVFILNTMESRLEWKSAWELFEENWAEPAIKRFNEANYVMFGKRPG